jgi:RNA polymerase sigma-70 factor (ECF subfamily)
VDDLAQQAFVTAYQSLADFQLGTDFYAWLRKIAYNHLRTELDRSRRRRRLERDQVAQALTDQLEQLQEEGPDAEVLEALRECLRLLREDAREVVERYYRDGTPLGDIARAIGRTAESLKVSLFKIRAQLRECMLRKGAGMEPEFP